MSVTDVVVVNSYSAHNELANKFASYLADECADDLYAWTGKVSANKTADQPEALNVFYAEYADSIPLPKMMETGDFWMQLEVLFSKVWNGADAASGLESLAEGIVTNNN
jgi:maltose-binding protein MalE